MKLRVKLDKQDQKQKQTDVWRILASTLPPAPKKTAVRLIIASVLLAVALAVFIVSAATDADRIMVIIAVVLLIAAVVALSGALYDLLAKRHKKKRLLSKLSAAVDAMYADIPVGATAEYDFGAEAFAAVYTAASGETVKKFTGKLTECAVVSIEDTLCVDFTDTDAYCFDAAVIGKDDLLALKKLLLMKHESYRDVERDDRGKYFLAGSDE